MSASGPRRRAIIAALPVAAGLAACTSRPSANPSPPPSASSPSIRPPWSRPRPRGSPPDPQDDPAEAGHPGAREADVTGYIDTMLGALDDQNIFAGGPWSNRHTSGPDLMARFTPLSPVARIAWRKRIIAWQEPVHQGNQPARQAGRRRLHEQAPGPAGQDPGHEVGQRVHQPAVRAHHRGPVRQPRVRRQPEPSRLEGDRVPRRHPAARLLRRRGGAVRRPRPGRPRQHRRRRRRPQAPRRAVNP